MLDALGDALQKLSTADSAAPKSVVAGPVPPVCESPVRTELPSPASATMASAALKEAPVAAAPAVSSVAPVPEVPPRVQASAPAMASVNVGETIPEHARRAPAPVSAAMVAPLTAAPVAAQPSVPEIFNASISAIAAPSETAVSTAVSSEITSNDVAPVAEKSSDGTKPSGSSSQVTQRQLLIAGIREHRHMVAALVIAVCGIALWKDTHSSTPPSVTSADDSTINMDSLLDDFEAVERPSLPDPAEPVNADTDSDAPLLIPSSLSSSQSHGSEDTSAPVTATYPDQEPAGFPSSQPAESQPHQKSRPLRFTGRIQPAR